MNGLTAAFILIGLNMFDAAFTYFFVSTGLATEVNPVMNFFISKGMEWFLSIKLIGVVIMTWILIKYYSQYRSIRVAFPILILYYLIITVVHMAEVRHMCIALAMLLEV